MPAGWYDDPFTDHLQRYWTGDSWTKEIRPRPDLMPEAPPPPVPPPAASQPGATPVRDYLILSILALIFCAWPLAIPAIVFSIRANNLKRRGDVPQAQVEASRARLWLLLSVALGIVVWVYLIYTFSTTDFTQQQTNPLTPFNA